MKEPKFTECPPGFAWGFREINGALTVKSKPAMKASPDGGGARGLSQGINPQGDLDWEHMG